MSDTKKTPVLFRMMKPHREHGDTHHWLLALFPTLPGTNEWWTCESYEHVGQHGSADLRGCIRGSRAAKPAEYANLAAELRSIGYNLDVKQRASHAMDQIRRRALAR